MMCEDAIELCARRKKETAVSQQARRQRRRYVREGNFVRREDRAIAADSKQNHWGEGMARGVLRTCVWELSSSAIYVAQGG